MPYDRQQALIDIFGGDEEKARAFTEQSLAPLREQVGPAGWKDVAKYQMDRFIAEHHPSDKVKLTAAFWGDERTAAAKFRAWVQANTKAGEQPDLQALAKQQVQNQLTHGATPFDPVESPGFGYGDEENVEMNPWQEWALGMANMLSRGEPTAVEMAPKPTTWGAEIYRFAAPITRNASLVLGGGAKGMQLAGKTGAALMAGGVGAVLEPLEMARQEQVEGWMQGDYMGRGEALRHIASDPEAYLQTGFAGAANAIAPMLPLKVAGVSLLQAAKSAGVNITADTLAAIPQVITDLHRRGVPQKDWFGPIGITALVQASMDVGAAGAGRYVGHPGGMREFNPADYDVQRHLEHEGSESLDISRAPTTRAEMIAEANQPEPLRLADDQPPPAPPPDVPPPPNPYDAVNAVVGEQALAQAADQAQAGAMAQSLEARKRYGRYVQGQQQQAGVRRLMEEAEWEQEFAPQVPREGDVPPPPPPVAPRGRRATPKQQIETPASQAQAPTPDEMIATALRWQGARMNLEQELLKRGDKQKALQIARTSGKSNLDDYLMRRYGITRDEAHNISNRITQENLKADRQASLDEFKGEPWAETAPKTVTPMPATAEVGVRDIETAHNRYLAQRQVEIEKETAWAKKVDPSSVVSPENARLPRDFSMKGLRAYMEMAWPDVVQNYGTKKAFDKAIREAIQNKIITPTRKGSIQVAYNDGVGGASTASGAMPTRPIGFDFYSRESVDRWASSQVVKPATGGAKSVEALAKAKQEREAQQSAQAQSPQDQMAQLPPDNITDLGKEGTEALLQQFQTAAKQATENPEDIVSLGVPGSGEYRMRSKKTGIEAIAKKIAREKPAFVGGAKYGFPVKSPAPVRPSPNPSAKKLMLEFFNESEGTRIRGKSFTDAHGDQWYGTPRILVKGTPDFDISQGESLAKGDEIIAPFIEKATAEGVVLGHFGSDASKGDVTLGPKTPLNILNRSVDTFEAVATAITDGKSRAFIPSKQYMAVMSQYPDAKPYLGSQDAVVFKQGDAPVALVAKIPEEKIPTGISDRAFQDSTKLYGGKPVSDAVRSLDALKQAWRELQNQGVRYDPKATTEAQLRVVRHTAEYLYHKAAETGRRVAEVAADLVRELGEQARVMIRQAQLQAQAMQRHGQRGAVRIRRTPPSPPATNSGSTAQSRALNGPQLLELVRELTEKNPKINTRLKKSMANFRYHEGDPSSGLVGIHPDTPANERAHLAAMAKMIGHAFDFQDEGTLKRGNILGHIYALRRHLRNTFATDPIKGKEYRNELAALSAWWRPAADAARRSAKELYSDALSVLLVAPKELEARAPQFANRFFQTMGNRPQAQAAWDAVQARAQRPASTQNAELRAESMAAFQAGREKMAAAEAARKQSQAGFAQSIKRLFFRWNDALQQEVKKARKAGIVIPEALNVDRFSNAYNKRHNRAAEYLYGVMEKTRSVLDKAGVTVDEFGEYVRLNRILGGRSDKANPQNLTPSKAGEMLQDFRRAMGKDKWNAMEQAAKAWHEDNFRMMVEAHKHGLMTDEVWDTVKKNRDNYATFTPVEYVTDTISAGFRNIIGSFDNIANPFERTVMKMTAISGWLERQILDENIRDLLQQTQAHLVKIEHSDPRSTPDPSPGKGILSMMEKGRRVFYEVDADIARLHERLNSQEWQSAIAGMQWVRTLLHNLYVSKNMAFALPNVLVRDPARTFINATTKRPADIPLAAWRLLQGYARTGKDAWKLGHGEWTPRARRLMAERGIGVSFTKSNLNDYDLDVLKKMALQYGVLQPPDPPPVLKRQLMRLGRMISDLVESGEYWGKMAADDMAMRMQYSDTERRNFVAYKAGTPPFDMHGTFTPISNPLLLYFNVFLQGMTEDYGTMLGRLGGKTAAGAWVKAAITQFGPKALMWAAATGLIPGVIGSTLKDMYSYIPEYDKTKYICIPYRYTKLRGEKAVAYLRIPHHDSLRMLSGALWKIMMGATERQSREMQNVFDALEVGFGDVPGVNPAIEIGARAIQAYGMNMNPRDSFKGGDIISRDAWDARRYTMGPMTKEFLQYTGGQFGVVSNFARPWLREDMAAHERALETAKVASGLSAFFKVSSRGKRERVYEHTDMEKADAALLRLEYIPDNAKSLLAEHYFLKQKETSGEGLDQGERIRLRALDRWHKEVYYGLRRDMTKAQARGNEGALWRLRNQMERGSERYED